MPVTDRMPTAGRLAAALCLAAVAFYASEVFKPLMPPQTAFGYFTIVNIVLGLLCGWFVTGTRLGRGYNECIGAGLTGMAALVFWALFLQSLNEMLKLALRKRYDGPVEGLVAIFEIAIDFGAYMLDGYLIGVLIVGGLLTGFVGEWVSRRWS